MGQAADQSGLVSIKDFVSGIRQQADVPSSMTDEEVARKVFEVDPSLMKGVQRIEPRRPMQQPPQSGFDRFTQGMAAVPNAAASAPFKKDTYTGIGQNITKQLMALTGSDSTKKQMVDKMSNESKAAGGASSLADAPNIKKDWQNNNKMGAAGRVTTQALTLGSMAKGMMPEAKAASSMGEMEAIGEASSKDAYLNVAKTISKPHSMMLDEQIGNIEKSMDNQFIDSQKLSADSAYAAKVMSKMKNVPEAQLSKVNAAKDAVAQLSAKIKANPKLMPWKDARGILKSIKSAERSMPPGTARDAIAEIRSGLEDRLQATADSAGQGAAYKKWVGDYRKLSNLQRAGARIMRQQTGQQLNTKLTAKEGTRLGFRRLGIQIGDSKAGKIAQTNKEMLGKWHNSLDELNKSIKEPPKGVKMSGGSAESDVEEARRRGTPQAQSTPLVGPKAINGEKPPEEPF